MSRAIYGVEGEFDVSGTNATAGATKDVSRFDLDAATVQAVASSGSYLLQASNNGVDWVSIGDAITASGLITLAAHVRYLRIFTTTAGNGEFVLFAHELVY